MANKLAERLIDRMREGGLFLTLTYRREPWPSPLDLYRAQGDSEQRHIAMFIHRLQRYLRSVHGADFSLRGRWMRKMEFHEDGFLHWHMLIDVPFRIPHSELMRLWGHGNVWINKATPKRCRYVAKYTAKTMDTLPVYLLGEPAGSIRVVAVSPGFWRDGESDDDDDGSDVASSSAGDDLDPDPDADDYNDHVLGIEPEPDRPVMKFPMYQTIGGKLEQWRREQCIELEHSIVRFRELEQEYFTHDVEWSVFCMALSTLDGCIERESGPWFRVHLPPGCNIHHLRDAIVEMCERVSIFEEQTCVGGAAQRPAGGVHLTPVQEPLRAWVLSHYPPWYREYLAYVTDARWVTVRAAA